MHSPINLFDKFALFDEHWSPKIIAELNGQHVKLAKVKGQFVWHQHEHEDEMFFVVKGELQIEFRNKTVTLKPNEMLVVPRGVEHRPVAQDEVWIMLFEPASTINTGDNEGDYTKHQLDSI